MTNAMTPSATGGLMTRNEHIVIRRATAADDFELTTLAVLDGGRAVPEGDVLVAEASGRLRAALGSNGAAISDPFWPSAELVGMLRVHVAPEPVEHPARFFARRATLRV